MTPYNPRIVFAAIVAYTDRESKDSRILATPEGFLCPTAHPLPSPILWTPPNHRGKPQPSIHVGKIEQAYVIDHRLITFGHLYETEEIKQGVVPMLQRGVWFLEIDVDADNMVYDLEPDPFEMAPVGPVTFKDWKLRAAWIGPRPCWNLPPVQIEEITR